MGTDGVLGSKRSVKTERSYGLVLFGTGRVLGF